MILLGFWIKVECKQKEGKNVQVEIVSTGTELLLGEITNTSVVYLSQVLNERGYSVLYHTTVGDNEERMQEVFKKALDRSDIVITTGGLGPTEGDITKQMMAKVLGVELEENAICRAKIKDFFDRRQIKMTQNNLRQALIPVGGEMLENPIGTAPGVWFKTSDGKIVIQLPGPPHEVKRVFEPYVSDKLHQEYGDLGVIHSISLQTIGIGESTLAEQLHDLITAQSNPTIALLSSGRNSGVRVRITARAEKEEQAKELLKPIENEVRNRFSSYIWGEDSDTLEEKVGAFLAKEGLTLAAAESCTGGLFGDRMTNIAGSSAYFSGGSICYSNEAKIRDCGVKAETLAEYGAVSQETALELAEGVAERFGSDIGIGITGIAGPDGGSVEKPVGLVYLSVWQRDTGKGSVIKYQFAGERLQIKERTVQNGLFFLYRELIGKS